VTILPTQHLPLQSSLSYAVILELLRLICNSLSTFKLTAYAPFDHKMTLFIFKETTLNIFNLPNVQQAAIDCTEAELIQRKTSMYIFNYFISITVQSEKVYRLK